MAKRVHGNDLLFISPLREGADVCGWFGIGKIGSEESQPTLSKKILLSRMLKNRQERGQTYGLSLSHGWRLPMRSKWNMILHELKDGISLWRILPERPGLYLQSLDTQLVFNIQQDVTDTCHFVYGWWLDFWKQQQGLSAEDLCGPNP